MRKLFVKLWPIYIIVAAVFLAAVGVGNRALIAMAEAQPIVRKGIMIIDSGHGGEDGGATSCTGVLESQINLLIALRLNEVFHLLGFETKMIRNTDVSIYTHGDTLAAKKASDLKNRVKLVNETENGILISIHQNTFSDSKYFGAQVFYAPTAGSMELAEVLQRQLGRFDSRNQRRIKPANHIYLMQHITRPGILIECGFLSNPEEEARLRDEDYQKMLCCVIASALSSVETLDYQTND